MIFEITGTASQLSAVKDAELLCEVVGELLRAHRFGHHLLILSPEVGSWIAENIRLSDREAATLLKIRNFFSQFSGLRAKALIRIVIDVNRRTPPAITENMLTVGLGDMRGLALTEKVQLLVENTEHDGKLLLKVFDSLKHRVEAPSLSYELQNGGGQALFKVWEQQIDLGRLVCMMADSDRRHFDDEEKAEIAVARKHANRLEYLYAWALSLQCREIENLLPMSIVEKLPLAFNKISQIDALRKIALVEEKADTPIFERFGYYYDMKKGVTAPVLEGKYGDDLANWTSKKIGHGGARNIFNGLGESIISQLLASTETLNAFLRFIQADGWWDHFKEMFSLVLWLGFAPRSQAT